MQIQQAINERGEPGQQEHFTISQVARLTGIKAKTIRYYESVGFLPRPARFANHYRQYSQTDINRLILLRCIRHLGVPLSQARSLLTEVADGRCLDVQQELLRLVNARMVALDQEIAELRRMRDEIKTYQHTLSLCQPDEREAFANCADMSCIVISDEITRKECKCDDL